MPWDPHWPTTPSDLHSAYMTATGQKILTDALALPELERRELAEALFDSLAADEAASERAWAEEIKRRVDQVRRGEVELESWEQVKQAGREALARHS